MLFSRLPHLSYFEPFALNLSSYATKKRTYHHFRHQTIFYPLVYGVGLKLTEKIFFNPLSAQKKI